MCRMLTVVSRTPQTLSEVVGPPHRAVFDALSYDHRDGWGAGWRDTGGQVQVVKGAEPAVQEARYASALASTSSDQLLVHLRKASPGMVVELKNCHPFTDGEVLFCHNGQIEVSQDLRASVTERGGRPCEGTTDSELYFALLLLHAQTLPWPQAVAEAVREVYRDAVAHAAPPMALNCFVLTPTHTYAYGHHEPTRLAPTMHQDFYRLQWAQTGTDVVIASSLWPLRGGSMAPDRQVIEVDRATLGVTVHPRVTV